MSAGGGAWLCRRGASPLVSVAVATGLVMGGAGGATAVADPGSHGSTGHDHFGAGASSQGNSSVGGTEGNPGGSVAGALRRTVQGPASMLGSGRNPGPQASSGATTQIVLRGTDNKGEKQNAGPVAPVTNVAASIPNAVAPVPNVVGSVPDAVRPIRNLVTPVTNVVASVPSLAAPVTNAGVVSVSSPVASGSNVIATLQDDLTSTSDTDFISNTHNFGLFTVTDAADPDDHQFVAIVISTPFGTDILTSGADPSGSLGFGAAGAGVPGETVNTLIMSFGQRTFAIPITDPLAPLFTLLVALGL
jgi:hypothetical protein